MNVSSIYTGNRLKAAIALSVIALCVSPVPADVHKVFIDVTLPPMVELDESTDILIVRFRKKGDAYIDTGEELSRCLSRLIRHNTDYGVIDVSPPALPEEDFEQIIEDKNYWREVAGVHEADLVIGGVISLKEENRSSYVPVERYTPTGRIYTTNEYVERVGYILSLEVYFVDGSTGEPLYSQKMKGDQTYRGSSYDQVRAFYSLVEPHRGEILGVIQRRTVREGRYIFY